MELRRIQGENMMKHNAIIEDMRHKLELETEQATKEYKAKVEELRKGFRAAMLDEAERYRKVRIEVEAELIRVNYEWKSQQMAQ